MRSLIVETMPPAPRALLTSSHIIGTGSLRMHKKNSDSFLGKKIWHKELKQQLRKEHWLLQSVQI